MKKIMIGISSSSPYHPVNFVFGHFEAVSTDGSAKGSECFLVSLINSFVIKAGWEVGCAVFDITFVRDINICSKSKGWPIAAVTINRTLRVCKGHFLFKV